MSKNRNRAKYNKAQTNREYKALLYAELFPLYWDDGMYFPYGRLRPDQWRASKTWKHNRKTQYKNETE